MTKRIPLYCLASLLLAVGASAAKTAWVPFSPKDGGFTVSAPGKLAYRPKNVPTSVGTVVSHGYALTHQGDAMMVHYGDYPASVVAANPPEVFIDGVITNNVNGFHGTIKHERPASLAGNPGRDAEIVLGKGGRFRTRVFMVGTRLYQIAVGTDRAQISADGVKFLNSLTLTGK